MKPNPRNTILALLNDTHTPLPAVRTSSPATTLDDLPYAQIAAEARRWTADGELILVRPFDVTASAGHWSGVTVHARSASLLNQFAKDLRGGCCARPRHIVGVVPEITIDDDGALLWSAGVESFANVFGPVRYPGLDWTWRLGHGAELGEITWMPWMRTATGAEPIAVTLSAKLPA